MRLPTLLALAACAPATAAPGAPAGPTPECDAATAFALDGAAYFTDLVGQRLWRGTCTGAHELLVASPDAWFASDVAIPAGILYTRDTGVWRYDFATRDNTLVHATPRGSDDDCIQISTTFHGALFDRVARLADDGAALVVERRGAGCHAPATWQVWITDWRDPEAAREHVAHPIHDLVAAGDVVYFADSAGVWTVSHGGLPVRVPTEGVRGVPAELAIAGDAIFLRTGAPVFDWGSPPRDDDSVTFRSDDRGLHWREVATAKRPARHAVRAPTRFGTYEATAYGVYVTQNRARAPLTSDLGKPLWNDRY